MKTKVSLSYKKECPFLAHLFLNEMGRRRNAFIGWALISNSKAHLGVPKSSFPIPNCSMAKGKRVSAEPKRICSQRSLSGLPSLHFFSVLFFSLPLFRWFSRSKCVLFGSVVRALVLSSLCRPFRLWEHSTKRREQGTWRGGYYVLHSEEAWVLFMLFFLFHRHLLQRRYGGKKFSVFAGWLSRSWSRRPKWRRFPLSKAEVWTSDFMWRLCLNHGWSAKVDLPGGPLHRAFFGTRWGWEQ